MTTVDQAKAMAKRLRAALAAHNLAVPHATALELVAAGLGHDDWNTACAALDRPAVIDGGRPRRDECERRAQDRAEKQGTTAKALA